MTFLLFIIAAVLVIAGIVTILRGSLLWGIVLFLAGLALWSGAGWARWFTIVACIINILGQLAWLGSSQYPLWTLTSIVLGVVVVYALTVRWSGYPESVG